MINIVVTVVYVYLHTVICDTYNWRFIRTCCFCTTDNQCWKSYQGNTRVYVASCVAQKALLLIAQMALLPELPLSLWLKLHPSVDSSVVTAMSWLTVTNTGRGYPSWLCCRVHPVIQLSSITLTVADTHCEV